MTDHNYDYIIVGGGLAGLQLANAFLNDAFFANKTIAVIDAEVKNTNDKTWCFWETGKGQWDDILTSSWSIADVYGPQSHIELNLKPYRYKMIQAINFYNKVLNALNTSKNITTITDEIVAIEGLDKASVKGVNNTYKAKHVFDSRVPQEYKFNTSSTLLLQHFKGWVIETKTPSFDISRVTMMDYRLTYKDTCSFTYVLPLSTTKALVEYTFFSPELVSDDVYNNQLSKYINTVLGITDYDILETEQGVIPMTDYKFQKHNTPTVTKIGTAGGWVKGSTGYSFKNAEKNAALILENIKSEKLIAANMFSAKHHFYDRVFLKVLHDNNALGPHLFEDFYRNDISSCFRFLDEASSLKDELQIIWSLKSQIFIKAFFKSL